MKLVWVQQGPSAWAYVLPDGRRLTRWRNPNGFDRLWLTGSAGQILLETGEFDFIDAWAQEWVEENYPLHALAALSEET